MPAPPVNWTPIEANTTGGYMTATIYSGAVAPNLTAAPGAVAGGSDILIWSGPGRLCKVVPTTYMTSGSTAIFFYDAAIVTSGGPFVASGHKIIAVYPSTLATASGSIAAQTFFGGVDYQIPFQSGLAFRSASGQPGFTVSWNSEVPRQ